MRTALTIAGSDPSGGAGIQADIKTMMANGVYAMSAITALTAQNTTGVKDVVEVNKDFLQAQIDCVFTDIFPDAVKTGMIPSLELMDVIVERMMFYKARNIVVDPVMIATSGSVLMERSAIEKLKNELLPIATLVTPNIPEAEALLGETISNEDEMGNAAQRLRNKYGCNVLIKGGHATGNPSDVLALADGVHWFYGDRIDNPNTHGTGCTLSSAIASNLANGYSLVDSVGRAKEYISLALGQMLNLGKGNGPLNHGFAIGKD